MPENSNFNKYRIRQMTSSVLRYIFQPRAVFFLFALFNFIWFFSQSSTVYHFGSEKISFCAVCPWYWDWSLTNPPSLLTMATVSMLFKGWKGYLGALIISGYITISGINWLSSGSGVLGGISQRIEVISQSDVFNVWELPDIQYLFAAIVLVAALIYLIQEVRGSKHFS